MKIQEFAKHLDEPREIGKKKKRLSSSEMRKVKDKAFEVYKEDWSQKYKRSIDCNNPKGFSQKAHCAGRKKHTNQSFQMVLLQITSKEKV
jgi:hypothetical protein